MSDLDLDALERLARAATPGPWAETADAVLVSSESPPPGDIICQGPDEDCVASLEHWPANREYLAACSPDVLLALIARVRRGEARAQELSDDLTDANRVRELLDGIQTQTLMLQQINDLSEKLQQTEAALAREREMASAATVEANRKVSEVEAALARVTKALIGVALNGSEAMPLYSWCDEGWTCTHSECVAGREALALSRDMRQTPREEE